MTTNKTSFLKPNVVAFIIPLALVLALVLVLNSTAFVHHQHTLAKFITLDFIITIPLVYFLLIRKTKISNLTIAPVLIACIIIASYAIPAVNQDILTLAKSGKNLANSCNRIKCSHLCYFKGKKSDKTV